MNAIRNLIDRFKEPSTWRGVAMLLTGFGVSMSPENMESIVMIGTTVSGVVGVFTKDSKESADASRNL